MRADSDSQSHRTGAAMDLADRKLKSTDCGEMLVFSAGEQRFFRDKGFNHDRKRSKRM